MHVPYNHLNIPPPCNGQDVWEQLLTTNVNMSKAIRKGIDRHMLVLLLRDWQNC